MFRVDNDNGEVQYYQYVGMSDNEEDWNNAFIHKIPNDSLDRLVNKYYPNTSSYINEKEFILLKTKQNAENFRENSLFYDPYELQLLEQALQILYPRLRKYITKLGKELFLFGFGIKGVHYFKLSSRESWFEII